MTDTLRQGVELMLVGMGVVFFFLALLVVSTLIMSALVKFLPQPEPAAHSSTAELSSTQESLQIVAVIAAAVKKYRQKN